MTDEKHENEYLDLPDDPEMAFAALQKRKYEALREAWEDHEYRGYYEERRYVDTLVAFDEVHGLGILTAYRDPPRQDGDFSDYFQDFRRNAEISAQKIMMEAARRAKSNAHNVIVLDSTSRQAIHALISAIREKLNELALPEGKRDSLFNKLNAFAAEVDRNRTRTEAFFAFAVEGARAGREVCEEWKPVQQTIDRVFDQIEKAKKWIESLPPWQDRKKIEGPAKQLPAPESPQQPDDDEIPF